MGIALEPPFELASRRLPEWIKIRPPAGADYTKVRELLTDLRLETVCREAHCPNLSECWSKGTATIMMLGTDCSRRCAFCAVHTRFARGVIDRTEPHRVAEGVARWGLRYVVLTQVCRDDLVDGGASILAQTVERIRSRSPETRIELLIGDLGGQDAALTTVLSAHPDVLGHNLETVRSRSAVVRDRRAGYDQSLRLLRRAKEAGSDGLLTKSSLILGMGETEEELLTAFRDLSEARVDLLTLGQYLRPSASHHPVERYWTPEEFDALRRRALEVGLRAVQAGPLVRSSYHAEELYQELTGPAGA